MGETKFTRLEEVQYHQKVLTHLIRTWPNRGVILSNEPRQMGQSSLLFSFLGEGGESMSSLMQETNLNSITVCSEGSFQVLFLGDTYMGMEQVGGE